MSSNRITSAEIKQFLRKYFSEHEYFVYPEFIEYLKQVTNKEFTKSQIAGCVAQLAHKHEIEMLERGLYRSCIPSTVNGYKEQIRVCLKNTISNLSLIIKSVDVVALNDEGYAELKKVRALADQIRVVIDNLADDEDKEAV